MRTSTGRHGGGGGKTDRGEAANQRRQAGQYGRRQPCQGPQRKSRRRTKETLGRPAQQAISAIR
jgi:hypothetical protein